MDAWKDCRPETENVDLLFTNKKNGTYNRMRRQELTMSGRCLIVGAGELRTSGIRVQQGDYVIAADGGYAYCRKLGLEPDLILGDFDSLKGEGREELAGLAQNFPERILSLPAEKDDTDMLAAIREGLKRGFRDYVIYGGLGGRLSHTIANLQCLNYLREQGARGYLVQDDGLVMLLKDETVSFPAEWKGYLSLFCFGERAEGVTIRNMKYLLDGALLTNSFPVGVSNEFIGKESSITVKKGTLLVIMEGSFCARTEYGQSAERKW